MFEIGDEIEVDEDFLEDVFNTEKKENCTVNEVGNNHVPTELPERDEEIQPGRNEILLDNCKDNFEAFGNSTRKKCDKAALFLNAWRQHGNSSVDTLVKSGIVSSSNKTLDLLQVLNNKNTTEANTVARVGGYTKNVRARKFPGPAGLLPERQGNTSLVATEEFLLDLENENKNPPVPEETEILSQNSSRTFECGCWGALLEDLGSGVDKLLTSISVRSVRKKARNSRSLKVPFLAVLLQNVDSTTPDPCLLLRDTTGEMHGALHRGVWERYGEELEPGSVLVLRNVGVISAGFTSRRHYLNITANNLASIYTAHNSCEVKRININPILRGDISRLVEEWERLIPAPPPNLSVDVSATPPVRLFSSALHSPRAPPAAPRFSAPLPQFQRRAAPPRGQAPFRPSAPSRGHVPFRPSASPTGQTPFRPSAPPRLQAPLRPHAAPSGPQFPPPHQPPKRPRFEAKPPGTSIFSANTSEADDVVESLLDGLDADSLFGDF